MAKTATKSRCVRPLPLPMVGHPRPQRVIQLQSFGFVVHGGIAYIIRVLTQPARPLSISDMYHAPNTCTNA